MVNRFKKPSFTYHTIIDILNFQIAVTQSVLDLASKQSWHRKNYYEKVIYQNLVSDIGVYHLKKCKLFCTWVHWKV